MFRGVQSINLDAKGRMAVPARQRESLAALSDGHIVMTVDTQTPCLVMYALPEWERIERDVQALPGTEPRRKAISAIDVGLRQRFAAGWQWPCVSSAVAQRLRASREARSDGRAR